MDATRPTPPIDASLLRLIEQAEIHALCANEAAAAISNDIAALRRGGAAAFLNRRQPNTLFNRCVGVGEEEAGQVDAIIAWYESSGVPPRFDICPPRRGPELTRILQERGLTPETMASFTRRLMVAALDVPQPAAGDRKPPVGLDIRRVASEADMLAFIDLQIETWPEDGFLRADRLAQMRASHDRPDVHRYLVWVGGAPIATAALATTRDVGWLSAGAVRAGHRGRGIQSGLIHHRMAVARAAGCAHAASLVSPGSGSERNLRRLGFTSACDRELWLPADWTDHPFYHGQG